MKNHWDGIVWLTETAPESNEVRVHIEGKVSGVDDKMFRKLQENGVDVKQITLSPEDEPTNRIE